MMLTFKAIQDQVLLMWDNPGETGNLLTLIKDFVNDSQDLRCAQQRWSFMRSEELYTITTASGQLSYPLAEDVQRLHRFYNATEERKMVEVPVREYYDAPLTKYHWHWTKPSPVAAQPSTTGTISILSSASADQSKDVIIRGLDGSDVITTQTITSNGSDGTTAVASSTSYKKILKVTKSGTFAGTLTVRDNATNTILSLGTADYGKNYPQIKLLTDPVQADTIEYNCYRKPVKLSDNNDIPDIPDPFSRILIWDTLLTLCAYDEVQPQPIWVQKQREWEQRLQQTFLEGQTPGARARYMKDVTSR